MDGGVPSFAHLPLAVLVTTARAMGAQALARLGLTSTSLARMVHGHGQDEGALPGVGVGGGLGHPGPGALASDSNVLWAAVCADEGFPCEGEQPAVVARRRLAAELNWGRGQFTARTLRWPLGSPSVAAAGRVCSARLLPLSTTRAIVLTMHENEALDDDSDDQVAGSSSAGGDDPSASEGAGEGPTTTPMGE